MSKLTIRQHKSAIGEKEAAIQTLASLGLRRPGNMVEREDSVTLRGQLRKVAHLINVEETKAHAEPAARKEQALKEHAIKEPAE
jgi:large subunit ribosomal protein L30